MTKIPKTYQDRCTILIQETTKKFDAYKKALKGFEEYSKSDGFNYLNMPEKYVRAYEDWQYSHTILTQFITIANTFGKRPEDEYIPIEYGE